MTTKVASPLSCLASSPSNDLVLVGGREILKIYSTTLPADEILNLRSKKSSILDVKWSSVGNIIASSSSTVLDSLFRVRLQFMISQKQQTTRLVTS